MPRRTHGNLNWVRQGRDDSRLAHVAGVSCVTPAEAAQATRRRSGTPTFACHAPPTLATYRSRFPDGVVSGLEAFSH